MEATIAARRVEAFNDSMKQPITDVVGTLRELLGAKLLAYVAGVSATRVVRDWAEGHRAPNSSTEIKLRFVFRLARLIERSEGAAVVPTWFQGMNPHLGDASPARVLREEDFETSAPKLTEAANAFVGA